MIGAIDAYFLPLISGLFRTQDPLYETWYVITLCTTLDLSCLRGHTAIVMSEMVLLGLIGLNKKNILQCVMQSCSQCGCNGFERTMKLYETGRYPHRPFNGVAFTVQLNPSTCLGVIGKSN